MKQMTREAMSGLPYPDIPQRFLMTQDEYLTVVEQEMQLNQWARSKMPGRFVGLSEWHSIQPPLFQLADTRDILPEPLAFPFPPTVLEQYSSAEYGWEYGHVQETHLAFAGRLLWQGLHPLSLATLEGFVGAIDMPERLITSLWDSAKRNWRVLEVPYYSPNQADPPEDLNMQWYLMPIKGPICTKEETYYEKVFRNSLLYRTATLAETVIFAHLQIQLGIQEQCAWISNCWGSHNLTFTAEIKEVTRANGSKRELVWIDQVDVKKPPKNTIFRAALVRRY